MRKKKIFDTLVHAKAAEYCERTNTTYVTMAEALDMHYRTLTAYFTGYRIPRYPRKQAIAEYLECEVSDLWPTNPTS